MATSCPLPYDLAATLTAGDAFVALIKTRIDTYIEANALDLPVERGDYPIADNCELRERYSRSRLARRLQAGTKPCYPALDCCKMHPLLRGGPLA
jgi:hypothetical protein